MQFGFWSRRRRGVRTYLSRTRNPQSFTCCVTGSGYDLQECFAGAQRGEVVWRDGPGTVAIDETRTGERHRCTAQESTPTLLVLGGTLSERQPHGCVLRDLLG